MYMYRQDYVYWDRNGTHLACESLSRPHPVTIRHLLVVNDFKLMTIPIVLLLITINNY